MVQRPKGLLTAIQLNYAHCRLDSRIVVWVGESQLEGTVAAYPDLHMLSNQNDATQNHRITYHFVVAFAGTAASWVVRTCYP